MNGNGNGNGLKRLIGGGGIVVATLGSGGWWVINKFDDINKAFATRNERITVMEYKMEALERRMLEKTEDRYTAKDASRDKAELTKRLDDIERRK